MGILSKVIGFLNNVKLSFTQWLGFLGATLIGVLVIALRIQGSRLHRAQIKLLDQDWKAKEANASELTDLARERYRAAVYDYLQAGGKWLLIACLLLSPLPSRGEEAQGDPSVLLPKCVNALQACDNLTTSQDNQIKLLQKEVEDWRDKAETEDGKSLLDFVPWYLWAVVGGVAGYVVGRVR